MPFQTPFNGQTSAAEVASAYHDQIHGKTIIVTGVSLNGLGAALCEAIAPYGPSLLIITGRDIQRPQAVAKALITQYPDLKISTVRMDLSIPESVVKASREIKQLCCRIDVLVNNAGVMCIPSHCLTVDKVETHLAVNYMGHFLLTQLLAEKLRGSETKGRVVNVSSSAHTISPFRFSDPNFISPTNLLLDEQPSLSACEAFGTPWVANYSPLVSYAQSKTALILQAKAIAAGTLGNGIAAHSVTPGMIDTNLWRHMPSDEVNGILQSVPTKSPEQGAATILVAALGPSLDSYGGEYLEDCNISKAALHANDIKIALRLWEWTKSSLSHHLAS